jgi:hypothetical protein
MTDYTSQIDAWYQAIQYRTPPAAELATFNAQLQSGIITTAQAIAQIEASPYTQTYVDPIIREYQAAFGRVPDQAGAAYWVGQFATNPNALAQLSVIFANSAEFNSLYGASATTPANPTLVAALYQNVLGRPADTAGLTYWSNQPLTASQLLQAFAQSNEYVVDTNPYILAYQNLEVLGTEPTTGSLYNVEVVGGVTTYTIGLGLPTSFTISGVLGGQPITGTVGSNPTAPITGTNNVVINAPGGLNDFQSIVLSGTNNVLNAFYGNNGANYTQSGLNIHGVQTWNVNASSGASAGWSVYAEGTVISFTGDASQGNVISDLRTVNFNDNSGISTLLIGDNSEPVQEPNGANGFAINVSNAVGTGCNGVAVDIAAQAFSGTDTIKVGAYIVGGFPQANGSYIIPTLEWGADSNDSDTYNPNWCGFQHNAFSIVSGASAGPNGAVGFQNWVVNSAGAKSVGTVNVLALGAEGATSAQTLTLTDDGSATFLFASSLADSLSTDWENLASINLSGTSGNVVLTGAEVDSQLSGYNSYYHGGGLLTSDTTALKTIVGGAGNSFYDLSSLTLAGIQAFNGTESYDGGHGATANSEIAFNNGVVASATATATGTTVNISHIQVLDDIADVQGGFIDLGGNFGGLGPLNANYDLLSGPLGNLFYQHNGALLQDPSIAYVSPTATPDVVPVGYQLLQFLNSDGSTETVLGSDLTIRNGFVNLAINAIDLADGNLAYTYSDGYYVNPNSIVWTGHNITIEGQYAGLNVNTGDHLKLWVSDDGVNNLFSYSNYYNGQTGTALYVPDVTIANYTTVDIFLPFESVGASIDSSNTQNYVILGGAAPGGAPGTFGFNDIPVITVNASVNFYDNTVDTGGSPPGGADNLVLGYTEFTGALDTTLIGVDTVIVDAFTSSTGTTINDYGHGTLEIGATDAAVLNAASTSHLIQDLSASTDWFALDAIAGATGITVIGSSTGQNLLQGGSGQVVFDTTTGHALGDNVLTLAYPSASNIGNDTLTGGADTRTDYVTNVIGNGGDNFFGEGGNDTINIKSAGTSVGTDSTVWIGEYNVGNSGGDNFGVYGSAGGQDWGVGRTYGQAITDINANGQEVYVNSYKTSTTSVTGFHVSGLSGTGDTVAFNSLDWAKGALSLGNDLGLVDNYGNHINAGAGAASLNLVSTAGNGVLSLIGHQAEVTLDGIGNYANASYLQQALTTQNVGDITFGGGLAKGSIEHELVAYNSGTGITIADVSIQNNTGHNLFLAVNTSQSGLTVTVTDLVHLTGTDTSIQTLTGHNIFFA